VRDYQQMNELTEKFGDKVVVLAFPCNQFGHQENVTNEELYASLKHVRPGNGYEPKFPIFQKSDVNGDNASALFKWLKSAIPYPSDLGPDSALASVKFLVWSPIKRSDISWNFEKFIIGKDGIPLKRYSPKFLTADLAADIEDAIKA